MAPGVYSVREIPGSDGHYAGRDDKGRACILLSSIDEGYRAPVRLTGLDVQYSIQCAVQLPGKPEAHETLTVLACTAEGAQEERYFLHVMASIIKLLGPRPKLQAIAEAVMHLAAIFQRLSNAARESVVGLVGELVLMLNSKDPEAVVTAWRLDPEERYDFVSGSLRLEVKTSMTRRRAHSLSYEQCDVPDGCVGVLASLFVEPSAGGLSLEELIDRIELRLGRDTHLIYKLEQTIAETLGCDLPRALDFRFDAEGAVASIAFFDLRAIPAVRQALPPGLSQVRFNSDVGGARDIRGLELTALHIDLEAFQPST